MRRDETKSINIGNKIVGGNSVVLIQSMCTTKTSNYKEVIKQINKCATLGADLMRVSILDYEDINVLPKIKEEISIPLICDIHFNLDMAIECIKKGADKIRINPGNTSKEKLNELIEAAKVHQVVIRIGINEGSIKIKDKESKNDRMVDELLHWVNYFEKQEFYDLVLSIKSSDVKSTIDINRKLAKKTKYPIHLGLTESGFDEIGIIRSVSALSPLLLEGIGSTIRISLTGDPYQEVVAAKRLLHDLGLYENYPTIISCPTCGRCKTKNLKKIANKVLDFMIKNNIHKKVAVMGCEVNGIGEGKNADLGIALNNDTFIVFKNSKIIARADENNVLDILYKELLGK